MSLLFVFAASNWDPEENHLGAVHSRLRECGLVNKRLVLVFPCFNILFRYSSQNRRLLTGFEWVSPSRYGSAYYCKWQEYVPASLLFVSNFLYTSVTFCYWRRRQLYGVCVCLVTLPFWPRTSDVMLLLLLWLCSLG